MQIRTFLQIPAYNSDTDEYCKNKTNIAFPSQYSMTFSDSNDEVVYILVLIKIHVNNYINNGHYVRDVLDDITVTWWICGYDKIMN